MLSIMSKLYNSPLLCPHASFQFGVFSMCRSLISVPCFSLPREGGKSILFHLDVPTTATANEEITVKLGLETQYNECSVVSRYLGRYLTPEL